MGAFFVYIVKSAVCLAVFYLFYRLLLSRETFHRFNRIALLGILILSCAIPFAEVTMKEPMEVSQQLLTWEELLLMADLNRTAIWVDDEDILSGVVAENYRTWVEEDGDPHPAFGWWSRRYDAWSARVGFKFSF